MKVEEGGDGESGGTEKYSRDLLQRLSLCCSGGNEAKSWCKSPNEETEELELSLGLSLGGKFGIEKRSKRLARSASVSTVLPLVREEDMGSIARLSRSFSSIIRTSSLPTESEEEFRKRKEWQSLRRLEAKRRRCEKQRKGGEKDCGDGVEGRPTINSLDKQKGLGSNDRVPIMLTPFGVLGSAAIAGQGPFGVGGIGEFGSKGKEGILSVGGYGLVGFRMVRGHGSVVEAQRRSSSASGGWSDSDGRPTQAGSSTSNETKSPASNGQSPEMASLAAKPPTGKPKEGMRDILPRRDIPETKPKVQGLSLTEDNMPCVFTKGDGPNGIRVDGILYKYGKGEEVRIMCICHGNFLSPAEFVRHAGGGEVANPRRHIFINTSTLVSR